MTLHFIHIPKTGGTAIKDALTSAGLAYSDDEDPLAVPETPYGRIALHVHGFRLRHVPPTDYVFFCIRDPISRFLSGFHSRLRKGSPRFDIEWTKEERKVFDAFPTPQRLVAALAGDDAEERLLGEWAMRQVVHFSPMEEFIGEPRQLSAHLDQVVYIARQETLGADWKQLRALLGLPPDLRLPLDPVSFTPRPIRVRLDTRRSRRKDPPRPLQARLSPRVVLRPAASVARLGRWSSADRTGTGTALADRLLVR